MDLELCRFRVPASTMVPRAWDIYPSTPAQLLPPSQIHSLSSGKNKPVRLPSFNSWVWAFTLMYPAKVCCLFPVGKLRSYCYPCIFLDTISINIADLLNSVVSLQQTCTSIPGVVELSTWTYLAKGLLFLSPVVWHHIFKQVTFVHGQSATLACEESDSYNALTQNPTDKEINLERWIRNLARKDNLPIHKKPTTMPM